MTNHPKLAHQTRRHVLVVDDDDAYLAFMQLFLTDEGYAVALATSVSEALWSLDQVLPDLVICDLRMPNAPFFGLLDHLDAERLRAIPVIVCTGAADQTDEARARLAGRTGDVLLKPFDIDDLLTCIRRVLQ
jgi:CheY-like chemotaxis protein